MEQLNQILKTHGVEDLSAEQIHAIEQRKVDDYNATPGQDSLTVDGKRHLFDSVYDCPVCKNKGLVAFLDKNGKAAVHDCDCRVIRSSRISARTSASRKAVKAFRRDL